MLIWFSHFVSVCVFYPIDCAWIILCIGGVGFRNWLPFYRDRVRIGNSSAIFWGAFFFSHTSVSLLLHERAKQRSRAQVGNEIFLGDIVNQELPEIKYNLNKCE
eukprot:m.32238 g.32238  ORF g.32238 m.32238 type:complete len:104 (-) comp8391_c0_seq1:3138-3449(-)